MLQSWCAILAPSCVLARLGLFLSTDTKAALKELQRGENKLFCRGQGTAHGAAACRLGEAVQR